MRLLRLLFAGSLACIYSMLASGPERASGQTFAKQLEPYRKTANEPGAARGRLTEFQEGKVALTKPAEFDLAVFAAMAQYLVNRVTHHEYYASVDSTELRPKPGEKNVAELISELRKYLLVPPADGKLTLGQEDYIRELGVALDKALVGILLPEKGKAAPPPLIRVNAARLLAVACESGAPAHWPTVTGLLKNPETPPELLFYALKASEGLLGGFDIARLSRLAPAPEAAEAVLYDLVHTLEVMVEKGPPILGKLHVEGASQPTLTTDPKAKPGESLLPDQVTALQLYRLQAIRALARLRSDVLGGKVKPALEVRPVYTLARVAIGDPSISPPFNRKEVAEAVIGMIRVNPGANLNLDELAYAISYGLRIVFAAKATNADDSSLAWKGYAGRLNAAFQDWQPSAVKRAQGKQKESITSLVKKATDGLVTPVLNPSAGAGGNAVKLELIDDWQRDNKPTNEQQLFSDAKSSDAKPYKLAYPRN